MKIASLAAVVVALALGAALAGVGRPEPAHGSPASSRDVTVTGHATVEAVPDEARFTFGVSTTAASARAAMAETSAKAQRVIEALRNAGIARADLRTQDVSVSPHWSNANRVDGYTAHSSVEAVATVTRAGTVVDAAVAGGATETSGPAFDRSDRDALYRAALRQAFADAGEKARTLAAEAHSGLGQVLRIDESSAPVEPPFPYYAAERGVNTDTPVEPGKQKVEATVRVTFSLA
jgi:uncharacterized protein